MNTLIIRYHRIGEAIIPLSLIRSLAEQYKDDNFAVISDYKFECLFELMPSNVEFIPMVTKSYTGIFRGLSYLARRKIFYYKLKKRLKTFDKIALFQGESGAKFIRKHIAASTQVVITNGVLNTTERLQNKFSDGLTILKIYKQNLAELGYHNLVLCQTLDAKVEALKQKDISLLLKKLGIDSSKKQIAIAPFSREIPKIYPIAKMEQVVAYFATKNDEYQLLIFGGSPYEQKIAESWKDKYPNVVSLIGKTSFRNEVEILARCKIALTMDSSNLHLASFLNVPVVSIWGATSPMGGYYPEKEPLENSIVLGVDCQPCSLIGGEGCGHLQQLCCLNIPPQVVIAKIESVLSKPMNE